LSIVKPLVCLLFAAAISSQAQQALPDAPTPNMALASAIFPDAPGSAQTSSSATNTKRKNTVNTDENTPQVDAHGNPIPVSRQQPKRILGLMPNYRAVSGGATPPPPNAKTSFKIATRQAFDYSSFVFLTVTSMAAEGLDEHPKLGKGVPGFYAYTWRGFLDKTDGNYLGGFLLPTVLHEDTRYYAMGQGNPWKRAGYAASRSVMTRTYGDRQTFNFSNIGGKIAAQEISKSYYPAGSTPLDVLAEKFGYSIARDVGFTIFREFYPDIATHLLHRHP